MRCPACGHEGAGLPLRCKECGRTYPRPSLEQYDRITFLLNELEDWDRQHLIPAPLRQQIEQRYRVALREIAERLGLQPEAAAPAESAPPPHQPVPPVDVWPKPAAPSTLPQETAFPAQEQPPEPVPLSIPRPRVDWGTIWQALLSPRVFEALLYIGAFLIIAAAATFVYFNWGRFSPPLQLLFLAGGTAVFFAVGGVVRARWHLAQSGVALIGTGALIIPVDFYAWARFRDLPPETYPLMWLAASAFCAITYAATTWWIRHRFFLVITLLAVHSALLAFLQVAGTPLAWWGAPTVVLAAGWLALTPTIRRVGVELPPAAEVIALVAAVAGIVVPTLSSLESLAAVARASTTAGPWLLSVAAAWWAGGGFFSFAARRDPRLITAYAAAVAVPVAVTLTMMPFVARAWVHLGLVALTPMYVLVAERQAGLLGRAARDMGLVLPVVGLVWASLETRTIAVTYIATGVLYLWWALRASGRPVMTLASQILILVGFFALADVAGIPMTARSLAILTAGVMGIILATTLHRGAATAWLLYVGAYVEFVIAVAAPPQLASPIIRMVSAGSTLVIVIYSALRVHRGTDAALHRLTTMTLRDGELVFHWSAAIFAATVLTLAWTTWRPDLRGLPMAGLGLAVLFMETGQRLAMTRTSYARPWTVSAIALSAIALALVGSVRQAQSEVVLTLLTGVATYGLWAWRLRAPAFAHAAAWLLLVPFALVLPEARARGILAGREAYAIAFAVLGAAYLGLGVVLERRAERFAVPWHTISQLLIPLALLWALQREDVARWTLTVAVPFYAACAWLIHRRPQPTFMRFRTWVSHWAPSLSGPLGAGFVAAAAWLFPFWYHLTLHRVPGLAGEPARVGIAATLLGWAYLGAGRWLGRREARYATPLWIAAQALVVVGGLLAANQRPLLIVAMILGIILQLGFYRMTAAPIWMYTAALGGTGLVGIVLRHLEVPGVTAGFVMLGLATAYLSIGERVWPRRDTPVMPATAAALYAVAFLDTAVGLVLASFRGPQTAAIAYALGATIFLWSGWRLREPLFGYAVAGLLAASYVMGLAALFAGLQTPEPPYGIWLIPGIAAFLVTARLLARTASTGGGPRWSAWAGPFYIAAHIGTGVMMLHAGATAPALFPLALAAGAAVYGASAAIFQSARWLYPALVAGHLSMFFELLRMGFPPQLIPAAFVPVTMVLAAVARRIEVGAPAATAWARPWYQVAFADLVVWELVGVIDEPTHVIASLGFAALAATFVRLWGSPRAATLALGLALVGGLQLVRWLRVPYPSALLLFSIVALLMGAGAVALAQLRRGMLWQSGARLLAIAVSVVTVGVAIWGVAASAHPGAGAGLVYVLAIVGLLYLLLGIADRREWLGYLAIAMLETAWAIFLLKGLEVREVQWYAIPAALYLLGIGMVERRLGRRSFAFVVDLAGLTLLLGSALWQSVGPNGFRYAVLLSVEALLVAWFGAAQRLQRHFFCGLGVLLVNVVVQAIDPLRALDKTVLFLSLGIVLVATAVLAERKRDTIIRTTREWRTRLEAWE